jgi:DNA-binding MarR family transcriptional regulator
MAGTTVPPADFVGCLAGNLRAASRVATRVYDSALRGTGLRITQVAVLAQVRKLQPLTVTELAIELSSERSTMARDVAVLEHSGLVTTTVKTDDRRAREVRLTSLGEQTLRDCAPAWHEAQAATRLAFGEARVRQLVSLANQLVNALEEQPHELST